jgi:uncharacterized protein (TIGR02302 family)
MIDHQPMSLIWRRRGALAVLWVEALVHALWEPVAWLAAAIAIALTGLPAALPVLPHLLLILSVIGGFGLLVRRGWRSLQRPTRAQADRRLEADSGLRHRPLEVLRDAPAAAGDGALWQAHQSRALASLGKLTLRGPRPGLAQRDPHALRIGALLLLGAGLMVGGPAGGRLLGQALFGFSLGQQSPAPVLQAWIEPPAYTGLSPIFLSPEHEAVGVPDGSKLTVSLTGGSFTPHLTIAGHGERFGVLGKASWQAVTTLHGSGKLRVSRFFSTVARWKLTILPNTKPDIAWASPPAQAEKTLETKLPWKVAQRWGVATLAAELRPAGRPDLPAVTLPIPLPGTPRAATGTETVDLAANPYAGVEMTATLNGRDVSGQTGQSAPQKFTLPARVFHDSLARAVADLRRRLALHPDARDEAADDVDALAQVPDKNGRHAGIVLNLAAVAALLRTQHQDAALAEAQERLWTIALALDGALPDASEQALAQARDSLRHALDERQNGKISDSELARKIQALRQALQQRLADIARKAMQKGQSRPDAEVRKYSSPMLDRMMKEMEKAAHEGRMEDAKQKLAELEKTLDRLKNARVLTPEEARQAAQGHKQAKQMMGAAQDLVQREGKLMDNGQTRAPTAQALPPAFHLWGQDAQPQQDPQQQQANQKAQSQDARTQGALSRALDALKQGFAASGNKVPANLDQAGQDMQQAQQALSAGDDAQARMAEGKAVQDLQKGGKDMARQMSKNTELAIAPGGQGQQGEDEEEGSGDEPGGQSADGKHDPLGRQVEGTGGRAADDGSVHVPTNIEEGRSRAIQEELRRRGADRERPQHELDYIDRLLKPFTE